MITTILTITIISLTFGIIYGYSFKAQHTRQLSLSSNRTATLLHFLGRLTLLSIYGYYLLRSASIHSILGVGIFIIGFWLIVSNKGANFYGRH